MALKAKRAQHRGNAPSHGEEIANGVADCRGFVAHFLSLTDPHPVNTALEELFKSLGLTRWTRQRETGRSAQGHADGADGCQQRQNVARQRSDLC
jgi:hypothetical protein